MTTINRRNFIQALGIITGGVSLGRWSWIDSRFEALELTKPSSPEVALESKDTDPVAGYIELDGAVYKVEECSVTIVQDYQTHNLFATDWEPRPIFAQRRWELNFTTPDIISANKVLYGEMVSMRIMADKTSSGSFEGNVFAKEVKAFMSKDHRTMTNITLVGSGELQWGTEKVL